MIYLFKYSGAIGIILMWTFLVVVPSLKYPILENQAYSEYGAYKPYKFIFNLFLAIIMFLQLGFIYYLVQTQGASKLAALIFSTGSVLGLLSSLVNLNVSGVLHKILGYAYFILTGIGAVFLSFSISLVLAIFPLGSLFSGYYFLRKKKLKIAEMYIFIFSSLWVLFIYFFI